MRVLYDACWYLGRILREGTVYLLLGFGLCVCVYVMGMDCIDRFCAVDMTGMSGRMLL